MKNAVLLLSRTAKKNNKSSHTNELIYQLIVCVCTRVCFRRQKSTESAGSDEEDVDELSLIDHKEIMSRITLKQEVSERPLLMLHTVFRKLLWQSSAAPAPVSPEQTKGHCESLGWDLRS